MATYSNSFYDGQVDESLASAKALVPFIVELVNPRSVIDVGCGVGGWLRTFKENGVAQIAGEDGEWVKPDNLLIDRDCFRARNLGESAPPPGKFDLSVSLEVAEHIDASNADNFVGYLTSCADTVLFSAAVPGQGGTHHVNEQPLSYWTEKFGARDFDLFDVVRPAVWRDARIAWWYRQNAVIFARKGTASAKQLAARQSKMEPLVDIAHPEGFFFMADLKTRFWDRTLFNLRRDLGAMRRRWVGR